MKPLNYKERNNSFIGFVTAGIITLVFTIFCLYFTNYFLTNAIAEEKVSKYNHFLKYKKNQQAYIKQLNQINRSLSQNFTDPKQVADFKYSYIKNGDTTELMKRIAELAGADILLVDQKSSASETVAALNKLVIACSKELNTIDKP